MPRFNFPSSMENNQDNPLTENEPPVIDFAAAERADAAAMEELRAILGPTAQAAFKKAVADVPAAVAQLKRSERGRQALADFKTLLANGGYGLDNKNWAALATMCRAEGTGDLG